MTYPVNSSSAPTTSPQSRTAAALLATDKLAKLCEVLEFDRSETDELLALREIARQPRWTAEFAQLLDDDLALYFGLEYGARKINTYEGLVVPGLLQSDDYAITLFRDDPATPGIRQPKQLELRHRRQQRLLDDDPLILHALIGQPVADAADRRRCCAP